MLRKWLSLLWTARSRLNLAWALIKDERVPLWQKAIPFLPLIYILSPMNLISFALPVVGQIDDALLIMLAVELMERVVDENILAEHKTKK
ncbi:MAG: DUF1232 domain-containing protein [Aggregatilineales bacterium]